VSVGLILEDFDKSLGGFRQTHQQARCPEPRSIFANLPPFVLRAAVQRGSGAFLRAGFQVIRREDYVGGLAQNFLLFVTEEALCSGIPARYEPRQVDRKDGEVFRALENKTKEFIAGRGLEFGLSIAVHC